MTRPRAVTVLALFVLGVAVSNGLGAAGAIQRYTLLSRLDLSLPPGYLILSKAVWTAAFLLLAGGLWRLKGWARLYTPLVYSLYLAQGWFDRLVLSRSDFGRESQPFLLAWNLLALGLVWGILWHPRVRRHFS